MISLVFAALGMWISQPVPLKNRINEETNAALRARDGPPAALDCAADIELFAACLASGVTPAMAAEAVAEVSRVPSTPWRSVAAMLSLGAPPAAAWNPMVGVPALQELARVSTHSHSSGSSLVNSCERIARDVRSRTAEEATAAAERAGVFIALPLAICFLPAFIVLGLLPIIITLATQHFT